MVGKEFKKKEKTLVENSLDKMEMLQWLNGNMVILQWLNGRKKIGFGVWGKLLCSSNSNKGSTGQIDL